jgi:acyl-CoA reductase-like NAD-dependent aldehyde dehydrogenase
MIDLHANYRNSVEGRLLETARTMQVINPATEEVFASVPDAGAIPSISSA